jgi:hypothetical protein
VDFSLNMLNPNLCQVKSPEFQMWFPGITTEQA